MGGDVGKSPKDDIRKERGTHKAGNTLEKNHRKTRQKRKSATKEESSRKGKFVTHETESMPMKMREPNGQKVLCSRYTKGRNTKRQMYETAMKKTSGKRVPVMP